MLYISLILSGILLFVVNVFVWSARKQAAPWVLGLSLPAGLLFASGGGVFFLPVLVIHTFLLPVLLLPWHFLGRRDGVFLWLSVASLLVVYGVASWRVWGDVDGLLREYPMIALQERLPTRPGVNPALATAHADLGTLEGEIGKELEEPLQSWKRGRPMSLKQLHEDTVTVFINRPGFGVTRMMLRIDSDLREGLRDGPPLPQPGERSTALLSSSIELEREPPAVASAAQRYLHQKSILDFVHPRGFGYIKDRKHVAGFQEHQFSEQPKAPVGWKLQTVDLVGLVVHPEPVVYVSKHLPRMDELRTAPTRPLDAFEAEALKELQAGEQLHVRDLGEVRRLLGAIRSVQQCLSCHEGKRGELLGAFSYVLAKGNR